MTHNDTQKNNNNIKNKEDRWGGTKYRFCVEMQNKGKQMGL